MKNGTLVMLGVATLVACSAHRSTVYGHLSGGIDAERTETRDLALRAGDRLDLSTPHGAITVRSEPGASSRLAATLRASGRSREEAEQVLQGYSIVVDEDDGATRVRLRGEPVRLRGDDGRLSLGAVVDYVVTVPEGVDVHADSSSGDIRVGGAVGACRLDTRYGSIELEGAKGDVSLHSGSGDLALQSVAGGRVNVDSGYGTVRMENVTASSLRAASRSGDVVLVGGRAETIELDTGYGAVSARDVEGNVRASSRSGDVELASVRGGAVAKSQYGRVAIDGVLTAVEARSSSGDVSVRAMQGSTNPTDWELSSGYGEVTLHVPADFGCELAAHTRYGEVECAFPITADSKRRNGGLKGVIGRGGRTVTMNSGSGNLAVKQL